MKKDGLLIVVIIFIILGIVFLDFRFPKFHNNFDLLVTSLTLLFLFVYTYDTRRLVNLSEREAIRPILLRSGYHEWDFNSLEKINGHSGAKPNLKFEVLKSVALDISGFLIMDKKKYRLHFGNEVAKSQNTVFEMLRFIPKWGWLPIDGCLDAVYMQSDFEECQDSNGIIIYFSDISGNKYKFHENEKCEQSNLLISKSK